MVLGSELYVNLYLLGIFVDTAFGARIGGARVRNGHYGGDASFAKGWVCPIGARIDRAGRV